MLLFFDIDGTLVEEKNPFVIPESAIRAINRAKENGHICMINTGRTMKLVGKNLMDQVAFDGVAAGCGTYLMIGGKEYFHQSFTEEESKKIIDGIRGHQFDACLEGKENNYLEKEECVFNMTFWEEMSQFGDKSYELFEDAIGKFDKFYCYSPVKERMEAFQQEFSEWLDFVDRKRGYYEATPKGYSKANMVEKVAEILGIDLKDTVAIGDSSNDIPMMERAKIAIAMGNATEDVKEIADYVTTNVEDDGIWNALDWLGVL